MDTSDVQQLLKAARQLPRTSQVQLVATLLQEGRSEHPAELAPLTGLSEAELHTLADAVLAPGHARRLQHLLYAVAVSTP